MTLAERATLSALMAGVDLTDLIPPRPAWMADGACREHPEVGFFPGPRDAVGPALAVCADCLARADCLAYAQENGECGVWGGQHLKHPKTAAPRRPNARKRDAELEALAAKMASWRRAAKTASWRRAAAARAKKAGRSSSTTRQPHSRT